MRFTLTRRQVLSGAALAAAAGTASGRLSALESVALGPRHEETGGDTLVVLFLRGGADGLNIVVPHGDADYYRLRPSLGLPGPKDRGAASAARCLDLDGFFGLHPALKPLLPLYRDGRLAAIHAVGSGDQTRSHFEAMATMERGIASDSGAASGWLARHLESTAARSDAPLRAVAIAETMPDSLRGATNATALVTLADYRLRVAPPATAAYNRRFHRTDGTAPVQEARADAVAATLHGMYGAAPGDGAVATALSGAGRETLKAMDAVKRLDPSHYRPEPGAAYPKGELGTGFQQAACIIKGDVGMEIACLDMAGWDTHVTQGRETGWQAGRLADLSGTLAAFAKDMGPRLDRVTIIVMTEFGRRAAENSGLGTDHGRASCMFLIGGGVIGGRVVSRWPGLGAGRLEGPGDLRVTTDYRDVLAEAVSLRLKNTQLEVVFPEYTPRFRGLFRPA